MYKLLRARREAGLTQADVADRMSTKPTAVARLESGGGSQKHSPSINTLRKYAEAVGCRLEIRLVRDESAEYAASKSNDLSELSQP